MYKKIIAVMIFCSMCVVCAAPLGEKNTTAENSMPNIQGLDLEDVDIDDAPEWRQDHGLVIVSNGSSGYSFEEYNNSGVVFVNSSPLQISLIKNLSGNQQIGLAPSFAFEITPDGGRRIFGNYSIPQGAFVGDDILLDLRDVNFGDDQEVTMTFEGGCLKITVNGEVIYTSPQLNIEIV